MRLRRRHILVYMIVLSSVCLAFILSSFDVYSRNKTINKSNKPLIEKYLSKEEKQQLIDDNINANLFIEFIKEDGFKLVNYEYYNIIKNNTNNIKTEDIVNKANLLVDEEFTLNGLEQILGNNVYDLNQLVELSTKKSPRFPNAKPNFYPDGNMAISNEDNYITNYKPNNLIVIDKKYTKKNKPLTLDKGAAKQFSLMCDNLSAITSKACGDLKVEYAYISYDDIKKNKSGYPYHLVEGHNDIQLGKTITFENSKKFNENKLYLWMLDNAHRYGFVQRYPASKVDVTKVEPQYGVFRYVGVKSATNMYNNDQTLEEVK
ncbi:MAG: D-alanyl-D-alanine carboxypeptidase family protein [Erysipelotrichales bacterium]